MCFALLLLLKYTKSFGRCLRLCLGRRFLGLFCSSLSLLSAEGGFPFAALSQQLCSNSSSGRFFLLALPLLLLPRLSSSTLTKPLSVCRLSLPAPGGACGLGLCGVGCGLFFYEPPLLGEAFLALSSPLLLHSLYLRRGVTTGNSSGGRVGGGEEGALLAFGPHVARRAPCSSGTLSTDIGIAAAAVAIVIGSNIRARIGRRLIPILTGAKVNARARQKVPHAPLVFEQRATNPHNRLEMSAVELQKFRRLLGDQQQPILSLLLGGRAAEGPAVKRGALGGGLR